MKKTPMNFKNIHIGKIIEKRVAESGIQSSRICAFMKCSGKEINDTYRSEEIGTEALLRWSKLLDYDFFRIYTQHLILYAPPCKVKSNGQAAGKDSQLPVFRKNIYTREIIDFILDLLTTGEKTKAEVIEEYRIPKTTLYKWISKNSKNAYDFYENS